MVAAPKSNAVRPRPITHQANSDQTDPNPTSFRLHGQGTFRVRDETMETAPEFLAFDAPLAHVGAPRGIRFELSNNGTAIHPPGTIFNRPDPNRFTATGTAATITRINDTTARLDGVHFDDYRPLNIADDPLVWDTTSTAATNTVTVGNVIYNTSGSVTVDCTNGAWMIHDFVPTSGTDSNIQWNNQRWEWVNDEKAAKRMLLRQKGRLPTPKNHRGNVYRAMNLGKQFANARKEELVALQLLRQMVPTDVFRKYLKHGFVTVQGPSGLVYQIKRRSHIINVWDKGELLGTLCVYLRDKTIPPTDEVVAKMIICELDELDIWKRANVSWSAPKNEIEQNPRVLALGVQGRRSADENHRWQAA